MPELIKKLIGFDEELIQKIEEFSKEKNMSFTQSVRILVEAGLTLDKVNQVDSPPEMDGSELAELINRIDRLEKAREWWNTDDIQSRIGNIEVFQKEAEKKINILTSTAKLFKGHLNNREIHLQD